MEIQWERTQLLRFCRTHRPDGVEKSVEIFVPEQNKWSYVSDMNTPRWGHGACVMGGEIYVIGGKEWFPEMDKKGNFVTTIECYKPANNSWKIVGENSGNLFGHAVVAV